MEILKIVGVASFVLLTLQFIAMSVHRLRWGTWRCRHHCFTNPRNLNPR